MPERHPASILTRACCRRTRRRHLAAMILVRRLMKLIEARLSRPFWTPARDLHAQPDGRLHRSDPSRTIVVASVVQGFGLGLVFVPLSTVAFATLQATAYGKERRSSPSSQYAASIASPW